MALPPPGPITAYETPSLSAAGPLPVLEAPAVEIVVTSYEGERNERRLYHGKGSASFIDGHEYTGEWRDGYMHGRGLYRWADGITYEGDFEMNNITGRGKYTWPGSGSYEGEVVDGHRHGSGVIRFELDEAVYEGQWTRGLREGRGKLTFNRAGTCFYDGEWKHDCKAGAGKMAYANGNSYEGEFRRDKKNGHGVMVWATSGERYKGNWHNGLPSGYGEHVWFGASMLPRQPNHAQFFMCNRYVGQFIEGRREGEGTFYYSTGARYEGQWLHNKKHGDGVFVFEDGTVFVGYFENDRPIGVSAERFGPADPGPKVYIEDLLAEEPSASGAYRAVLKLLLCHNSKLRQIYDSYCAAPPLEPHPHRDPGAGMALLSSQAWRAFTDCGLVSKDLSLADCCEMLLVACRAPPPVQRRRQRNAHGKTTSLYTAHDPSDAFSPTYAVLFREFCECLVRIAHKQYHAFPNIERRVHKLINEDILPRAKTYEKTAPDPQAENPLERRTTRAKSTLSAEEAPPAGLSVPELMAERESKRHIRKMDTTLAVLFSIAARGGVASYLEAVHQQEELKRQMDTNSVRHSTSFRGRSRSSRSGLFAASPISKMSRSATVRGCLKMLHECKLLRSRDQPAPPEDAQEEGCPLQEPLPEAEQESDFDPNASGASAALQTPRSKQRLQWVDLPMRPASKLSFEAAYSALLESLLPASELFASSPPPLAEKVPSLSAPVTPSQTVDSDEAAGSKPATPMSMPAGGEEREPTHADPEWPINIWMLDYKVIYPQFVEWLARCAVRVDRSEKYPLYVKLSAYLRSVVEDVLLPQSVISRQPEFLEDPELLEKMQEARRREREEEDERRREHEAAAAGEEQGDPQEQEGPAGGADAADAAEA